MYDFPTRSTGPVPIHPAQPHSALWVKVTTGLLGALLTMSIYIWSGMVDKVGAQDAYHAEREKVLAGERKEDNARVTTIELWRAAMDTDRERWRQNEARREAQMDEYDDIMRQLKRKARRR
jgi:hypothetical protein